MSGKQRGLFRLIFKHCIDSITPTFNKPKLMGEDYYGTKYYEISPGSKSRWKRPTRYFKSVNEDFEQELPAEWESWLRYRRTDPPTYEEIVENYKLAVTKKVKGDKIEAAFKEKAALKDPGKLVKQKEYRSFPVYEDYNNKKSNLS